MELIDLRQVKSRTMEGLFTEEAGRWRAELHWDYNSSLDLIRKFIDTHSLGGYVAIRGDRPAGYGFYVLEDHKGLIGGLFVSSHAANGQVHERLLAEMLATLRGTPHIERVEAQLIPFGEALDTAYLARQLRLHPRQFMLLELKDARLKTGPFSGGMKIELWSDRHFEIAARLIHLAYARHVDAEINDQYRSEAGGLKFLRNIVLLPGCGQFLPEASFFVRPSTGEAPVGMILTSTVAPGVAHTTQLCVIPGHQGHGIGRLLMESSIRALRARGFQRLSLTVTSDNRPAVTFYESLGFRTIKTFVAGVWEPR